jgi:DMATS type aromatic prenyltransferase
MLSWARLDPNVQYAVLLFHYHYVVSHLGPGPYKSSPKWKSFMTDDFPPIEYSWTWDSLSGPPKFRYSIEPIGSLSGSESDPFNRTTTLELVSKLKPAFAHTNWELFDFLESRFKQISGETQSSGHVIDLSRYSQRSSMFLGFDINGESINLKAYFTLAETGCSKEAWGICFESIQALGSKGLEYPASNILHRFLTKSAVGAGLEYVGLAVDCVDPKDSRLKIYFRSPDITFESATCSHNEWRATRCMVYRSSAGPM